MTRLHTDLSRVPVSVAPSPATSGTSLGVTDANAAYLPDTYPYWAVLVPTGAAPTRANAEIVKVTGGSSSGGTTTLTIVRAQGTPVTTAQTVTTSFDIYDANSAEANIGLNGLVISETPSGTVNGSNTVFTLAIAPVTGTLEVERDGQGIYETDDWTLSGTTLTFVTAPATGSKIRVNYQKTVTTSGNADTLDGYHANATPTAGQIPVLDSKAKLPYSDGWTPTGETWTYASADAPTFVITVPSGAASIYNVGDRIKLTQTTVKYFIITAITDTTLTVYGGTDYTLVDAAISANYYSHNKCPLGFPTTPAKWTVTTSDTSDRQQTNPVSGTWYNLGSITISIPIGVWDVDYQVHVSTNRSTAGALLQYVTLSTANNSESDTGFSTRTYNDDCAGMSITLARGKQLTLTSKTAYYLNSKDSIGSNTQINFLGASIHPTVIKAVSLYL